MRTYGPGLLAVLLAGCGTGCGPGGPPNLEGFGDVGETENDPSGDGDGDPGDGDGAPGDGDGEPGECIDAVLGDQVEVYHFDYVDPSGSSDHDGPCVPTPGADYSMTWRAPGSRYYRAELWPEGSSSLTVLRGGCDGLLENCDAFAFPVIADFYAEAGQDYTFVVDGEEFVGYFDFYLYPIEDVPPPPECPEDELFDVPSTTFGSTWDAGYSYGSSCGGEESPDRAYVFWPPITGLYDINTFGSSYDTLLHVLDGYCGFDLIDCNDDAFDLQSQVLVELAAGQPYTVVVDGWGGSAGDYQLNIELTDASGLCDDVIDIGAQVPAGFEWPSDFTSADVFQGCTFTTRELHLRWTAPADGIYEASFASGPLYAGLSAMLDGCFGDQFMCDVTDNQPPSLMFDATAGQEIIFVPEWEPDGGVDNLLFTVDALGGGGPGCGQALPVGVPSVAAGTTQGSGDQYSGTCSNTPVQEVERWWTAPQTGSYRISLEGSNYDTLLYVRAGGCDGPELACNDDTVTNMGVSLWSSVELDLVAGQTISIFVDGYNGTGNYQLAITSL